MTITIPLSKTGKYAGKYEAIIDDIDADLAELNWQLHKRDVTNYANRSIASKKHKKREYLHRIVLSRMLDRPILKGEDVDHINHNGLDNRRENLRLATRAQNQANRLMPSSNTSGFKGVYWNKNKKKWTSCIRKNGKIKWLGYFLTPQEAHEAYCKAAKELFGEFANFG